MFNLEDKVCGDELVGTGHLSRVGLLVASFSRLLLLWSRLVVGHNWNCLELLNKLLCLLLRL